MQSPKPSHRAADPPQHVTSGMLSLNFIYDRNVKARLCTSNCRSIEVEVLYPLFPQLESTSLSDPISGENLDRDIENENKERDFEMEDIMQKDALESFSAPRAVAPVMSSSISAQEPAQSPPSASAHFRLLSLPLELRLKIYGYILPPRVHKIITQIPHNGYYYNTLSVHKFFAQSFYPFGRTLPSSSPKLTTYKILNDIEAREHGIRTAILRVCKQVHREAEGVMYGSKDMVLDCGVHVEAFIAFMGDRSKRARSLIKNIRVAREIPVFKEGVGLVGGKGENWEKFERFLREEITGVRDLDLTVWAGDGRVEELPVGVEVEENEVVLREQRERKWREWDGVKGLLNMESMKVAKITWWGFDCGDEKGGKEFDSWVAQRMVGDRVAKERMVKDGVVVEGVVVLRA